MRSKAAVIAVAFVLFAPSAFAQSRLQARRHFQKGMNLIARGQYDAGIDELREAYAIKPHPNVLFNIARAQVEAGHVEDALQTYRQYLRSDPPDAADVRDAIAALEKKLPPKETPPVEKPLTVEKPVEQAPSVDPALVARLNELADRMETALNRLETRADAPSTLVKATPEEQALGVGDEEEPATSVPYEETVAIASRRAQTSLEAPNSTTVITGEEILLSGATTIVDLLRRVPGAEVMQLGVGSANVSFRGFNQRIANKVLVLLDGRTEYQDFIGLTLWSAIPVGLEEIDRVEIIRGPGSALYGANAMLGVINIITRTPGSAPRSEFNAIAGSGDTAGGSFVASLAEGPLRYRASVGYEQANKWSRDYPDNRADIVSRAPNSSLGLRSARGNLTTRYVVNDSVQLGASAGVNRFYTEIYPLGLLRNYFLDGMSSYVMAESATGPVKFRGFWNQLEGDASPQYEIRGQRSLATHVSSHVFSGELVFSNEFMLRGLHRLDIGVAGRLKRVGWDYLDEFRQEPHAAAFIQDEWRMIDQLRLVASYRVDRHPLLDYGKPGYAQSPRISALFFPAQGHAVRASFATAFREPTFLESYTSLRIPVPGVNGASALTTGDTTLRPEQLTAFELGYRGELPASGLEWDLAVYRNEVKNLVTLSALNPLPAGDAYDAATGSYLVGRSKFENESATYQALGAELGATVAPLDRLEVKLSAAWQKISQSGVPSETPCAPCSQAPQFKLYGGASYRATGGIDLSLEANYVSTTTWIEREPAAADPTTIEAKENRLPAYTVVNARLAYRLLKDKLTVGIIGSQLGAPHREHPFGNLIERRVYATLTVVP